MLAVMESIERGSERIVAPNFRPKLVHKHEFVIPVFTPRKSDEHLIVTELACSCHGCKAVIPLDFRQPVAA